MKRAFNEEIIKSGKILNFSSFLFLLLLNMFLMSCKKGSDSKTIAVKNELDIDRKAETISIRESELVELINKYGFENLLVRDVASGQELLSQLLDYDADGTMDEIIFQVDIEAKEEKLFSIEGGKHEIKDDSLSLVAFSRFVPERIDDYAWENDLVAFRTYGPEAQRLTDNHEEGGTLTSGIDAWFKRVEYPVIDKWYAENLKDPGAYHKDTGEGYDPYHVGASRGIGGIGVWKDDSLYVSKNFVQYKRIANGPIRTVFELTYEPWEADGDIIKETKRISLDLGSNLSRFDVTLDSDQPLPNATIGITLHEKTGSVKAEVEKGWFRYWETIDGSNLGTGIVVDPVLVQDYLDYRTDTPDQSHLFVHTEIDKKIIYYAGFGWDKSGQFKDVKEWDQYLNNFSKKLDSPLIVKFL